MKALFKNKFFTIVFALFLTFSALLGITATLPRSAKADDTTSDIPDFSIYTAKEVEVGDVITGCWLKIWVESWGDPTGSYTYPDPMWEYIEIKTNEQGDGMFGLLSCWRIIYAKDGSDDTVMYQNIHFSEEESALYVYIDEVIHGDQQPDYVRDQTGWTFKEAMETFGNDVDFKIYVLEEGTAKEPPLTEEKPTGKDNENNSNNFGKVFSLVLGSVIIFGGVIGLSSLLIKKRKK